MSTSVSFPSSVTIIRDSEQYRLVLGMLRLKCLKVYGGIAVANGICFNSLLRLPYLKRAKNVEVLLP
ncbi:MAG: hypothetical protein ACTS73_04025 [Arsenophonus sp. NEOnobi-MAG3]